MGGSLLLAAGIHICSLGTVSVLTVLSHNAVGTIPKSVGLARRFIIISCGSQGSLGSPGFFSLEAADQVLKPVVIKLLRAESPELSLSSRVGDSAGSCGTLDPSRVSRSGHMSSPGE
ncbi:hypothetical protein H920_03348 [Fukomys damarensis]|uniref:Uncharacterized protein n=1 Tax=Fukomys damarensis TaxID=885580 RepID=A0A091DXQ3_FUKDA|nr:hypothetical protein H920_03348 [Fukomys damarensis]